MKVEQYDGISGRITLLIGSSNRSRYPLILFPTRSGLEQVGQRSLIDGGLASNINRSVVVAVG